MSKDTLRTFHHFLLRTLFRIFELLAWLFLKALSATTFLMPRRFAKKWEYFIIQIGNFLFRKSFKVEAFDSYESYYELMPVSTWGYNKLQGDKTWAKDKLILDLGSGLGQYSVLLTDHNPKRIISLEYQQQKSKFAQLELGRRNLLHLVQQITGSAYSLPLANDCIDLIFSHTVFEHLEDLRSALNEIRRVLVPGGQALIGFNFFQNRGGHHLFPFVRIPWAPWLVSEASLCEFWSEKVSSLQDGNRAKFWDVGCKISTLSDGAEIHLNKVNFDEFEGLIKDANLHLARKVYSDSLVKLFPFLLRVPKLKYFVTDTVYYSIVKNI